MLREAAGIGLDEMITLAFAYWGYLQGRGPGDPVRVKAMAAEAMTIPRADVETFLGLFSCTPAGPGAGAAGVPTAVADAPAPGQAAAPPRRRRRGAR